MGKLYFTQKQLISHTIFFSDKVQIPKWAPFAPNGTANQIAGNPGTTVVSIGHLTTWPENPGYRTQVWDKIINQRFVELAHMLGLTKDIRRCIWSQIRHILLPYHMEPVYGKFFHYWIHCYLSVTNMVPKVYGHMFVDAIIWAIPRKGVPPNLKKIGSSNNSKNLCDHTSVNRINVLK